MAEISEMVWGRRMVVSGAGGKSERRGRKRESSERGFGREDMGKERGRGRTEIGVGLEDPRGYEEGSLWEKQREETKTRQDLGESERRERENRYEPRTAWP